MAESKASLEAKRKTELQKIARDRGIRADSATKPELIRAIVRSSEKK